MSRALLDDHDVVLLDLDGTVYRGGELIPGARESIELVHTKGVPVRYVTNNASKPDRAVVDHLTGLGLSAELSEVSTSAQAGAAMLAEKLPAGARVLVVGSPALRSEVDKAGLVPVSEFAAEPVAVVQGLSTDLEYRVFAEACLAIRAGALWVATNGDRTLPTERGLVPGNGALVQLLSAATDQQPLVAGKPERPLLDRAVTSAGGMKPLMIGDRLDTDIAGAVNAGMPVLMVLTGVSTAADLLAAPPETRPDYLGADLLALHRPPAEIAFGEHPAWTVHIDNDGMELSANDDTGDAMSALRTLCATRWSNGSGPVEVRGTDDTARQILAELGLH